MGSSGTNEIPRTVDATIHHNQGQHPSPKKKSRETALAKSAVLLRDAAISLKLLRLDYWPEMSLTNDEIARRVYRNIEPLLKAIGEARGVFDAALEVVRFQLVQFKAKSKGYYDGYLDLYGDLYADIAWKPRHTARREAAIRQYLRKKLSIHLRRSKRIMEREIKAKRQG